MEEAGVVRLEEGDPRCKMESFFVETDRHAIAIPDLLLVARLAVGKGW